MKRIKFILIFCVVMLPLFAQDVPITEKINQIKLDTKNYIYAEATMENCDDAFEIATELLENYIREYAMKNKSFQLTDTVIIRNIAHKSYRLQMRRGEMYRAFVYVKRNDVLPASNGMMITKGENLESKNNIIQKIPITPQKSSLQHPDTHQQEIIDQLLCLDTAEKAYAKMSALKVQGKIISFGMPKDCKDVTQSYWLVADKQGKIITILGVGNEARTNFKEKKIDSLSNYHDIAIWFTM